jgi:hypothetical protein
VVVTGDIAVDDFAADARSQARDAARRETNLRASTGDRRGVVSRPERTGTRAYADTTNQPRSVTNAHALRQHRYESGHARAAPYEDEPVSYNYFDLKNPGGGS